jgi:hypothetical protein
LVEGLYSFLGKITNNGALMSQRRIGFLSEVKKSVSAAIIVGDVIYLTGKFK